MNGDLSVGKCVAAPRMVSLKFNAIDCELRNYNPLSNNCNSPLFHIVREGGFHDFIGTAAKSASSTCCLV
jgi:hypothetical protein